MDIVQSPTDAATSQIIDLTEDGGVQETLHEWRSIRSQQDQEYMESLLVDQAKLDEERIFSEMEDRRKKVIGDRQLRMAFLLEEPNGIPLRFKYPSGITRTRRFALFESIEVLFDFVGEVDDATEYFHIQDALSLTTLKSTMSGTLQENISGSQTLYVHWIQHDHPEFIQKLQSSQDESPSSFDQFLNSPLPSPVSSPGHDTSFSTDQTDLSTILSRLGEKIDHTSCPTSNQINICRDYSGNIHNLMKSALQAFKRRRFNPEARLDVIFVDSEQKSEGAVDGGGPTRELLRLLMKAIHQSSIFKGPENDKRLTLDTHERLFCQVCDEPTQPATLEEISDVTFKEKLIKIKEAVTVKEAKAAIDEAEDCLAITGAWRSITSLKQRDTLVQSAIDFFVEGRLRVALQQFVEGLKTLGLLQEMRTHPDLFRCMFVEDMKPLKASDISALFHVRFSTPGTRARELESKTVCFWRDWLIDVEEGECSPVTLENVLVFASGSSTIPPNGFLLQPTIEIFPEELGKIFPEANTCNIVLKLPVHNNYDSFKAHMCNAILWAPTFGVA